MLRSINGSSLEFVDLKHDKEQQATKVQFCSRDKIVVGKKKQRMLSNCAYNKTALISERNLANIKFRNLLNINYIKNNNFNLAIGSRLIGL